jgi:hypothetical protein
MDFCDELPVCAQQANSQKIASIGFHPYGQD